jgi:predicted Zn-dependent peptidase
MKTFEMVTLPSGLTVVLAQRKQSTTATVLVLVAAGSKYEAKRVNGISHFLEHLCFKGTKKRPKSNDISSELDGIGASYNAFTSHEFTGYYAKVDPTHLKQAIDVVSDIYLNQIFKPEEIKKESGVIVEELNMYEDTPRRKAFDNLTALLYGDQPAGWNIAGTKKIVTQLKKKDFEKYRSEHYVAGATTVVVSGNFKEKGTLEEIKKKFSNIRTSKKKGKIKTQEKQSKPALSIEYKKTDQTHLLFGFRAFPYGDKRAPALNVLATILGGSMSSRLFDVIRGKLGAAYYVNASEDLYTDHGYLAIGVGAANSKVKTVIKAVLSQCKNMKEKGITEKELQKAKDYIIGKTSLSLETTDELAWHFGEQHLMKGKVEQTQIMLDKIRDVSVKDVQTLAKEIFKDKNLNLAVIGPLRTKKDIIELLRV